MGYQGEVGGGKREIGDGDSGGHLCDEHRVMCGDPESLSCTSETTIALYISSTEIQRKELKTQEKLWDTILKKNYIELGASGE